MRELKFLEEVEKESWALALENLLKETLYEVHNAERQGLDALSESAQVEVSARYDVIFAEGLAYHNALPEFTPTKAGKRGRKKQRPGKNLLDRLLEHKEDVLRFAADFRVPFTNNLGERDLCMQKVKQKISGCFRTLTGARMFCRIRGFISTAKKRALSVLQALRQALAGHPVFAPAIP